MAMLFKYYIHIFLLLWTMQPDFIMSNPQQNNGAANYADRSWLLLKFVKLAEI